MKEIVVNKKQKNRFYQPQIGIIEVVEPTLQRSYQQAENST